MLCSLPCVTCFIYCLFLCLLSGSLSTLGLMNFASLLKQKDKNMDAANIFSGSHDVGGKVIQCHGGVAWHHTLLRKYYKKGLMNQNLTTEYIAPFPCSNENVPRCLHGKSLWLIALPWASLHFPAQPRTSLHRLAPRAPPPCPAKNLLLPCIALYTAPSCFTHNIDLHFSFTHNVTSSFCFMENIALALWRILLLPLALWRLSLSSLALWWILLFLLALWWLSPCFCVPSGSLQ